MSNRHSHSDATEAPIRFNRVICGIDQSPQSMEALRQAVELTPEGAKLWAVSVWDPALAVYGGIHASTVMSDLRREGAEALNRAREAFPDLQLVLMRGSDVAGLLDAAAEVNADLISVGSHGGSRMAGITFGSVASGMAHYAPCSVLIARTPGNGGFPGLILHASDGSSDSLEAARVAGDIAAGHGSKIITVNIGDDLDRGQKLVERTAELIKLAGADPVTEAKKGSPHRAILELANSARASLVVVGSRGLTGIRALGSVSERVAHRAPCSVLVVRRAGHPKQEPESADTSS